MNDAKHVACSIEDQALIIRLQREEKKNALNHAMYSELLKALEEASVRSDVRCAVITGSADCFTAGNDLADFAEGFDIPFNDLPVGQFLVKLALFEKPIIAAVNGPAVGIGTTMLLHCDIVYAGENTRFQMPFVPLGLCPEAASSFLLPRAAGYPKAARFLLLGEPFGAQEAYEAGIINAVCSPEDTLQRALEDAQKFCALPPSAVRESKKLLKQGINDRVIGTLKEEGEIFMRRLASPEATEAFNAFMARRKPDFQKFD